MLGKALAKVFGSKNDRMIRQYRQIVARINGLEEGVSGLDDARLAAKTVKFRERIAQGESLDALLPEVFAVVREAARRTLGERHYDVQRSSDLSTCSWPQWRPAYVLKLRRAFALKKEYPQRHQPRGDGHQKACED